MTDAMTDAMTDKRKDERTDERTSTTTTPTTSVTTMDAATDPMEAATDATTNTYTETTNKNKSMLGGMLTSAGNAVKSIFRVDRGSKYQDSHYESDSSSNDSSLTCQEEFFMRYGVNGEGLSEFMTGMHLDTRLETDSGSGGSSCDDMDTRTANGALCLSSTMNANVDFFASPFIFFNGEEVARNIEKDIQSLYKSLDAAYDEDPKILIQNVLHLGNLRACGKKSHGAYMVCLGYLWKYHPKTFLAAIAPKIVDNTSARDLLTIFCVITPNRSYPISRLYAGEQPDSSSQAGWTTVKEQEKTIWKALLKEYDVKSSDVVSQEPLHAAKTKKFKPSDASDASGPVTSPTPYFMRDTMPTNMVSPTTSTPTVDDTEDANISAATNDPKGRWFGGTGGKRGRSKTRMKNIWHNLEFKDAYQSAKFKLHQRDFGVMEGIDTNPEDYKKLTDFVVDSFVEGLKRKDEMMGKWAPTTNGSHDKATRGVKSFDLPDNWNGGLSQAIAWKLFGHLVKKDENDGIGGVVFSVDEAKRFVMEKYSKSLSDIRRKFVPESLEGSKLTCKDTPNLARCTARWRVYRSPQTQTTSSQKEALKEYYKNVAAGAVGFKALTSGGNRPHVLMRECCVEKPDFSDDDGLTDKEKKEITETAETQLSINVMQFESIIESVRKTLSGKDVEMVAVTDVSGSMTQCGSVPMDVSVAMGIILSMAMPASCPYAKKVYSFSSECHSTSITARDNDKIGRFDWVREARREVLNSPWGQDTNLRSVFKKIAEDEEKRVRIPGDVVKPLFLVIITDMQWNQGVCDDGVDLLQEDVLRAECTKAGLATVPTIVYFDVAGSGKMSYPASVNTSGVVMMSGYSESAIKCLSCANFDDVSPKSFMLSSLAELPYETMDEMIVD